MRRAYRFLITKGDLLLSLPIVLSGWRGPPPAPYRRANFGDYLNRFSRGLQYRGDAPELSKRLPAFSKACAAAAREVDEVNLIPNPHERTAPPWP
jgi:hypothetical protein